MNLTQLFCNIDDFCKDFIPGWQKQFISDEKTKKRNRSHRMSYSEIITIWVFYHRSGNRTFKWFYQKHIQGQCQDKFPDSPNCNRFIEIAPEILVPITVLNKGLPSYFAG